MEIIKIEDIPEFDTRIKNIFRRANYIYLDEIENIPLLRMRGISKKTYLIVSKAIYKYLYKQSSIFDFL